MMSHPALGLAALLTAFLAVPADIGADKPKPKDPKPKKTNRLARETSPYLLQHSHNPVDWYPWGAEAFAKAKKEGKLVFLSIGYSSCHWCHVMEKQSFSNEAVAKILNDHFVCIKVDREERPDIDAVYMAALHALGEQGGWPLSMFLTADGKPIVGGTYWPPDDKEIGGRKLRGFKTILKLINDTWKKKPKDCLEHADAVAKGTARQLEGELRAGRCSTSTASWLARPSRKSSPSSTRPTAASARPPAAPSSPPRRGCCSCRRRWHAPARRRRPKYST